MLIRIPQTFRAEKLPATVTLSDDDLRELLENIPGEIDALDDEYAIQFKSPHAAADLVSRLDGRIPYLASNMDLKEEILFTSLIEESPHSKKKPTDARDRKARGFGIAGLSVGISSAVAALAALAMSIIALTV